MTSSVLYSTLAMYSRCMYIQELSDTTLYMLFTVCNMVDFCEQHVCNKFPFELRKINTECYEILKLAHVENAELFQNIWMVL